MSLEKSLHVAFWNKLLQIEEQIKIPQRMLNDIELQEIEKLLDDLNQLAGSSNLKLPPEKMLLMAFRLEIILLHPAMLRFFLFSKAFIPDDQNPLTNYEQHLHHFFDSMKEFGGITEELKLISESTLMLWKSNLAQAEENRTDSLTGALTRRSFFDIVIPMCYAAPRQDNEIALLMVAIDDFKKINDTLGHLKGDLVLHQVARTLMECVRKSDIVGRYGGEKFIIFTTEKQSNSLQQVADRIKRAVKHGDTPCEVTLSMGIAQEKAQNPIESTFYELIAKADQQLYKAKRGGKNRICL